LIPQTPYQQLKSGKLIDPVKPGKGVGIVGVELDFTYLRVEIPRFDTF
jgi:hypothetical protein